MKSISGIALPVLAAFSLLQPPPAAAVTVESLGRIEFPNSGTAEAQEAFIRGVLLLHSFEYEDAREAFQKAQRIDPEFALAYWGEAMTHNHPLWRQQDREAALAVLDELAPTAEARQAKAPTERERGYLRAIEVLYGAGDKVERDRAYSDAMRELCTRFPDDLEAKSFYALSILGTTQGRRDFGTYMRAGAVAEEVFAANPEHPGAAHYLIHSYDDPIHAPLGLRAARVYAEIAPAASHAQHMISHIFVALGRWADSVESNVKSFEVSRRRAERKGLSVDALNYHSFHWLEYSYLQLGRFDDARAILDRMRSYAEQSGSSRARWHYASMRANWAAEGGPGEMPDRLETEPASLAIAGLDLFATAYAAWASGDHASARAALDELTARRAAAPASPDEHGKLTPEASRETLEEATVMEKSLQALVALEEGQDEQALVLLREATDIEAARPLEYGPPSIPKPAHELYGEVLLRLGKPEAAIAQFETALERAPRRRLSLEGLARAAEAAGERASQRAACGELTTILSGADPSVTGPPACDPQPTRVSDR